MGMGRWWGAFGVNRKSCSVLKQDTHPKKKECSRGESQEKEGQGKKASHGQRRTYLGIGAEQCFSRGRREGSRLKHKRKGT